MDQITHRPAVHQSAYGQGSTSLALLSDILCRAFQANSPGEAAALELARVCVVHQFAAKKQFIACTASADALWLLTRGRVSVGHHDGTHHWRQTRAVLAGGWIDAESAWLGGNYLESAYAETAVTVCEFPVRDVEQALMARPKIARTLLAAMAERVRRLTCEAHDLLAKNVLARCAGWLVDELQSSEQSSALLMRQHKRSIAAQLGTSPETFSRTLRRLCEMQLIAMDGYQIQVRDTEALRRLSTGVDPAQI